MTYFGIDGVEFSVSAIKYSVRYYVSINYASHSDVSLGPDNPPK